MRERDWTDRPLAGPETRGGLTVEVRDSPEVVMVTGDLQAARATLAPGAAEVGLGGDVSALPAVIRLARDRALITAAAAPGWHQGYAVSAASDLYQVVHLSGPQARHVLAQGTSVDLDGGSPSALVRFAGETVLILRQGAEWQIWVEPHRLTALSSWLRGADLNG